MHVARSADELRVEGPCLVDRYLDGALELDVDALCDGETAWVAAVLEHIEPTGVHSGDSACVLPGPSVLPALEDEIREVAARIAGGLGARGLLNLQLAVTGGKLYVLEANPRASRTVPFVAKATGVPLVEHAVRLLLGESARGARPARACRALARLGEGGRVPGRAVPGRGDPGAGDALDRRGDGRRRHGRPRPMPAPCAPPAARSGAGKSARRCRRPGYRRADARDHRRDRRGGRGRREGRRRHRDRHDPLGAAPARREDGRPPERPVHRLGLGRLRRGRRRRARELDLRRRGGAPGPLRRHRRRGLGGRALVRRRDRRLGRAGRSRAVARGARPPRRGRLRDALHEHRDRREASRARRAREHGPARGRHLRRGGRRARCA